ncbi:MAG TPA: ABC transporter permease [Gemmatimonadales bacterium]|nr:ABC transporter permease [Gemmatimonadales bacterium]
MGALSADLRLAVRRLRRSAGFTAAAVLTLALGIGANTAFFSLADAALLRPLPYPTAGRLVMLWERQAAAGKERERASAANFLDWRRESRALDQIAAWAPWGFALTGDGEPEELASVRVSANMFRLLGVSPALGRAFLPEEETSGRDRVVVLSHGFWAGRMGADPEAVGKTLTLDGMPHQIVGVMPDGFRFPDDASVALWNPLAFDASELVTRAERRFNVIGRLAPGATLANAATELEVVAGRLADEYPETNAGWTIASAPAAETVAAEGKAALSLLLGTVALVLLLACANVGHLFLARALDRGRELAIRTALGGAPARLLRLLVIECAVVAAIGAAAGVALAAWAVPLVQTFDPGLLPGWRDAVLDGRVLAFTLALLVPVTFFCGVVPAWRAVGLDRASPLTGAGERLTAGRDRGRVRRGLIVAEVALSVVLLVAAGLHLRSLVRLQQVDPGFHADGVLAATVFLSGVQESEDAQEISFFTRLLESLARRPEVAAAGAVTTLPMNPVGIDYDLPFSADGSPPPAAAERQEVDFRVVAGDYFRTLGVPVERGRGFEATDREDAAPVVLVNRTLANRFFAGQNPVGRRVWVGGRIGVATVVGVVGDVRHRTLAARPRAELYAPFRQYPHGGMTVVVRTSGDPAGLARIVKEEIYRLDRAQAITDLVTLPELIHGSVSPQRFTLLLLGGFAGLALLLAAVGVYGVIAYAVGRRTREIGIRMALGAAGREIQSAVVLPAVGLAAVGIVAGSAAAWLLGRAAPLALYEVSPHDPLTFALAAGILLAASVVACAIPARRAARLDPLTALRSE